MWEKLTLKHFKCFQEVTVPLAPLTFLSGVNAAGKSTIIQSLALLNQTITEGDWNSSLILNGSNIQLGSSADVINKTTSRDSFQIGLETRKTSLLWEFGSVNRNHEFLPIIRNFRMHQANGTEHTWTYELSSDPTPQKLLYRLLPVNFSHKRQRLVRAISNKLCAIKYLSAERLGPRETYAIVAQREFSGVGAHGEYTANYLHASGGEWANSYLTPPHQRQTNQKAVMNWMNVFFPGFEFAIFPVVGANLVTLQIRTSKASGLHRPQNVGYGITHILPIITLCVSAKRGETILIENPETHLHPAGQSLLGTFLARTAASGVQVIVESHSDHVLNGIRKAVVKRIIKNSDVVFNFVTASLDEAPTVSHTLEEIRCDVNGRIKQWPVKFFDQLEHDLMELT